MDASDIVLPLHIAVLLYAAWNILQADHLGLKWMTGKVGILKEDDIRKYHIRVWIGLIGMMMTRFIMFWPTRELLLSRLQF